MKSGNLHILRAWNIHKIHKTTHRLSINVLSRYSQVNLIKRLSRRVACHAKNTGGQDDKNEKYVEINAPIS